MKTAREALSEGIPCDYYDLSDYRYQPSRFTKAVYAVGDKYWCVSRNGALPKPTDKNREWVWIEKPDSWLNKHGWKLYYVEQKSE